MNVRQNITNFIPKQPFMVDLADSYYKHVLNKFGISHFYLFQTEKGTDKISLSVPDGCIDLIFHYDNNRDYIGADWYGTALHPHSMKCYEKSMHFGVRFIPGQMPVLADAKMPELIDKIIPYEEVGREKHLPEMIAEAGDFKEQIETFQKIYLKIWEKNDESLSLKKQLVEEVIHNYGNLTVQDLSQKTGYSSSYIDKIFRREIGISPKQFMAMMRFQGTLMDLSDRYRNNSETDYAELVDQFGYYDQAHMINEFKKYSRSTPGAYIKKLSSMDYSKRLIEL